MKAMGKSPPRLKETDKILSDIYAVRNEKLSFRPDERLSYISDLDQFGAGQQENIKTSILDCCECGEPYEFGKGFICGQYNNYFYRFCPTCFIEFAVKLLKESEGEQ